MKNTTYDTHKLPSGTAQKQRNSNLELYRILTMLLIIAHHYVVNSGLTGVDGPILNNLMAKRSLFLLMFGAFGKTGINCFVLITGYFMCKSQITARKFVKLLGEVLFYGFLFNLIFWCSGYEPVTLKGLLLGVFPITSVAQNFTGCYLLFFLCIPFLNMLLRCLSQLQHLYLLAIFGFMYILMGTVPFFYVSMNYVSWFAVLYFIAAYIRLYPVKIFERTAIWGVLTLLFIVLSLASVLAGAWISPQMGQSVYYTFVSDSNTMLAVLTGISSFLFFKNLKMPYSRFINTVSGTTFGVLLIHAANDAMRRWLWRDVLNNVGMYSSRYMPLHAIGSVLAIFVICSILDLLRIRFVEKPFLRLWDRHSDDIMGWYLSMEKKFCEKFHISSQCPGDDK